MHYLNAWKDDVSVSSNTDTDVVNVHLGTGFSYSVLMPCPDCCHDACLGTLVLSNASRKRGLLTTQSEIEISYSCT
jgi:hypothetical protein